jgi:hypothetical protein
MEGRGSKRRVQKLKHSTKEGHSHARGHGSADVHCEEDGSYTFLYTSKNPLFSNLYTEISSSRKGPSSHHTWSCQDKAETLKEGRS